MSWAEDIPTTGPAWEINYEAIAKLDPELIVGVKYWIDEEEYALLEQIAPTVMFEGETRGDWKTISAKIADVTNSAAALEASIEVYESRLAELRSTYADVLSRPWTHFSLGDDAEAEFSVQYPSGSSGDLLHNDLGAALSPDVPTLSVDDAESGYQSFSIETIADVLGGSERLVHFLPSDGNEHPLLEATLGSPLFALLPAVSNDSSYGVSTLFHSYESALSWLEEIEETILIPEQARG